MEGQDDQPLDPNKRHCWSDTPVGLVFYADGSVTLGSGLGLGPQARLDRRAAQTEPASLANKPENPNGIVAILEHSLIFEDRG